jgi:transposase
MARIGEDVSERLDVIPAQFRVLVTRRPKYACRRCSQAVAQAHAPEHVVPGGLPTELLIAWIIVSKFGDHLPFYRQAEIVRRQGIALDRGTLGNWVGRAQALARGPAVAHPAETPAGRRHPLHAGALVRPDPLPRRRHARAGYQPGREPNPPHCPYEEKGALRRQRGRRRELGHARLSGRHLQDVRRQPGRLHRRHAQRHPRGPSECHPRSRIEELMPWRFMPPSSLAA